MDKGTEGLFALLIKNHTHPKHFWLEMVALRWQGDAIDDNFYLWYTGQISQRNV